MSLDNLAEAVILQALEDLWSERYKEDSISFFAGNDFFIWSSIAGLDVRKQYMILLIVSRRLNEFEHNNRS